MVTSIITLIVLDAAWKYHMMAALPNIDVEKKWCTILRNYKANIYKEWQFFLRKTRSQTHLF